MSVYLSVLSVFKKREHISAFLYLTTDLTDLTDSQIVLYFFVIVIVTLAKLESFKVTSKNSTF